MAASGEVSWLGACMTVPREPPVWLVCSATPLRPGTLVGWLRTDLLPPLLLIDSILTVRSLPFIIMLDVLLRDTERRS